MTHDPFVVTEVDGTAGVPSYEVVSLRPIEHEAVLIIPVINEGSRILQQLAALESASPNVSVILADGGSTDGSTEPEQLYELGVSTLLVKTGPGKLSAQLRMGMDYALRQGAVQILTMDGNGKDGVEGVESILSGLSGGADFVQGSRFVPGGVAERTPIVRSAAIRLIHAPLTSIAAKRRFTDTTNGFRGHTRALLTDPQVAPFRDVFSTYELLAYLPIRAARLGYQTAEVPVARRYPSTGATPTKIHGMRGNSELMRILWRAARGRYAPTSAEIAQAGALDYAEPPKPDRSS